MKRVRGGQNVRTEVRQFITIFVIIVVNIIVNIMKRAERGLPPEFMRPWPICVACNFCEKKLMRCHTRHKHIITPTHCNILNYKAEKCLVLPIIDTILSTKRICHCCQKNLLCKCLKILNVWLENIFASDPAKCGAEMENKQNVEVF